MTTIEKPYGLVTDATVLAFVPVWTPLTKPVTENTSLSLRPVRNSFRIIRSWTYNYHTTLWMLWRYFDNECTACGEGGFFYFWVVVKSKQTLS